MASRCEVHPGGPAESVVVVEILGGDGVPFGACSACFRRMTTHGAIVPPIDPVVPVQQAAASRLAASPARLTEAARLFAPGKP